MGTNTSDIPRLESSWRMLLANKLHYQDVLLRSEAMTKAGLTCKVLDALGKGIANFSYYEQDGSFRVARGTLKRGIDIDFDSYIPTGKKKRRSNSNTDGTYVYWDLDEGGFRSFCSANLVKLISSEIPQLDEPGEPIVVEPERPEPFE